MPTYNVNLSLTAEQDVAAAALASSKGVTKAGLLAILVNQPLDSYDEHLLNQWWAGLSVSDRRAAKTAFEAL